MNTYSVYYYGIHTRTFVSRDKALAFVLTRCSDSMGDNFDDYEILDASDQPSYREDI
jgi:hypothetical protein